MTYKLGSLFDGSGGFPLAGAMCGIEPVWAAEIEPYPIAVTRSRFPRMKHLGDISKINGAMIEPVDIITFGSPCQDLSVAGKRAGLKHEANGDEETTRSGLFMEAVRIIKEMREATNGEYPRYALWENVPGAFSSNSGNDFRIVLEELIRIAAPDASMPPVPKAGWNYADSYTGDGWSLAYRVFDAQYWGVPQRRRRIHLIADFRGTSAREILFEREGLRGYFAEGRTPWKDTPADAQGGSGADDRAGEGNGDGRGRQLDDVIAIDKESWSSGANFDRAPGITIGGPCATLQAERGPHGVCYSVENHPADSRVSLDESGLVQTLTSRMGTGGGNVPMVMEPVVYDGAGVTSPINASNPQPGDPCHTLSTDSRNYLVEPIVCMATQQGGAEIRTDDKAPTLTAAAGMSGNNQPVICLQGNGIDRADTAGCNGKGWKEDTAYTLNTIDRPAVAYGLDRASFNQGQNAKFDFTITEESQPTLTARGPGAVAQPVIHASKASFFTHATEGAADTLVATDYKDPQLVAYAECGVNGSRVSNTLIASMGNAPSGTTQDNLIVTDCRKPTNYIVRRLTPTECARLQGFADWWSYLDAVDSFSQKDYQFWLDVRHTHEVVVKGKDPKDLKDYTVKQMLTWYNKLWTDSAEYKMWGNGIALPPALYCMQGITDVLNRDEEEDSWML